MRKAPEPVLRRPRRGRAVPRWRSRAAYRRTACGSVAVVVIVIAAGGGEGGPRADQDARATVTVAVEAVEPALAESVEAVPEPEATAADAAVAAPPAVAE